jgi:acid phosphatase
MKKILSFAAAAGLAALSGVTAQASGPPPDAAEIALRTRTPIKHLIVVVGENVTFDTLFGTYVPKRPHESVSNLLSKHIVNVDGTPGPRYFEAVQFQETNLHGRYTVDPIPLAPYERLPQPTLIGVFNPATLQPFGAIPDPRFASLDSQGPFQITQFLKYADPAAFATGDPVHRFFQMWQQTGGTSRRLHSFIWVAVTTGQGGDTAGITPTSPGQGAELMGFFNMATGDAPYFNSIAQSYALSDNYHQAMMGGTGANFFMLATGDAAVYNTDGQLSVPPANQIENPDPAPGTANFYVHDGYSGGSYVNCSDATQPAVDAILDKVRALGRHPNCQPGAYYLVNNYEPAFTIDGQRKTLGPQVFAYPPQSVPTIGEALSAKGVSWKWYTGGRDVTDVTEDALYPVIRSLVSTQVPPGTPAAAIDAVTFQQTQPLLYNSIGDPHNGSAKVVNGPLRNNLKGLASFYQDVAKGTLPAVSYVVPKNLDSGHPGYSAPPRYELFIKDLVTRVQSNPELWQSTAILVTTDEGGGYFDTGRIQNLDFFGDGPRIPLIAISPFARAGHVDHVYNDHVSILKFIEHNWHLPALSNRSRDRLPNPITFDRDDYLPLNAPAIGNLTTLFEFPRSPYRPDHDGGGGDY